MIKKKKISLRFNSVFIKLPMAEKSFICSLSLEQPRNSWGFAGISGFSREVWGLNHPWISQIPGSDAVRSWLGVELCAGRWSHSFARVWMSRYADCVDFCGVFLTPSCPGLGFPNALWCSQGKNKLPFPDVGISLTQPHWQVIVQDFSCCVFRVSVVLIWLWTPYRMLKLLFPAFQTKQFL